MDMWGVGCVMFEVLSLYPLFPGTNELDQVTKIHNILGTPNPEMLAKLKKHSNSHIDFNFPPKEGTPLGKLIPHCSADCVDLITRLLAYDPEERISARQAVKHAYFREFREAEKRQQQACMSTSSSLVGDESDALPSAAKRRTDKGENSMLPSIPRANADDGGGNGHGDGGGNGDDGSGGMLPPINAPSLHSHGVGGGLASLKIDSKSLLASQGKSQAPKSQKKASSKKSTLGRPSPVQGLTQAAQACAHARACAAYAC
eukprot:6179356-Pleurochrysis_carterae.AAC.5